MGIPGPTDLLDEDPIVSEWTDRDERQADAAAQYEHIMTTPAPPAIGAYIDAGVIGFVFGEMWRRGVLTPRDRRWVTLACVGVAGAPDPDGDAHLRRAEQRRRHQRGDRRVPAVLRDPDRLAAGLGDEPVDPHRDGQDRRGAGRGDAAPAVRPWTDPVDDDVRRARGEAAYESVHGVRPPEATTAFRGRAYLRLPLRRGVDARRVPHQRGIAGWSPSAAARSSGVDAETGEHLEATLRSASSPTRNCRRW